MRLHSGKRSGSTRDLDLDVVRGLAILLAMGWHFNAKTHIYILDIFLYPGHRFGWARVDLFFVLSGFLVGRILLKEQVKTGGFARGRFMVRRGLKLWPVLYLFLLAQLAVGDKPWNTYFFQNALHVQNFAGSSLSHLWSLAVEEHFYLLVALAFPVFTRRNGSPATLMRFLGLIIVGEPLLRIACAATWASFRDLQWQTQFRIDGLAMGALLATISIHYPETFATMLRLRWVWGFLTLGGVAYLTQVSYATPFGSTLGYTVTAVTGASLLLLTREAPLIHRNTQALKPLGILGVYSYSLYLWHQAAAKIVTRVAPKLGLHNPGLIVITKYICAISLAVLLTRLIEWPFLRLRERIAPTTVHAIDETDRPTRDVASNGSPQQRRS
jgi:peptidoglycan/LPS O-acetylase OafA/YrhL